MHNRARDLQDCFSLYAGPAMMAINAGIDFTPFLPLGIRISSGPEGYCFAYGMNGRKTGLFQMAVMDLPFNFVAEYPDYPYYPAGSIYFEPPKSPGWNNYRLGRVGAHVGVILVHMGAHVEVIEISDFILGWSTLDLCGDDEKPPVEEDSSEREDEEG
jgi:hypothetical protein